MSWTYTCDICNQTFDAESQGCECSKQLAKDYQAVDQFAHAMKLKLAKEAEKGRCGWDDKETCSDEHLANLFFKHLTKCNEGNFIDLANFLMFLHVREAEPSVLSTKPRLHFTGSPRPTTTVTEDQLRILKKHCCHDDEKLIEAEMIRNLQALGIRA